jgi:hypothetical protein
MSDPLVTCPVVTRRGAHIAHGAELQIDPGSIQTGNLYRMEPNHRLFHRKLNLVMAIHAFLLVWACTASQKTSHPSEHHDGDPYILTTLPMHGNLAVQLYVAPCLDEICPLQLRLQSHGKIVSTETLEHWQPGTRKSQEDTWYSFWDRDGQLPAYTWGDGENTITVAIQLVRLQDRRWAVLIRQSGGFEHIKRRYSLYKIRGRRFEKLWSRKDGAGPHMTDVIAFKTDDDIQSLLYLDGFFFTADNDRIDTLRMHLLHWSNDRNMLVEDPGVVLPALWVGRIFDSIAAARSALTKYNTVTCPKDGIPCLSDYWILKSDRFRGLAKGKVVIASVALTLEGVKREHARLQACMPDLKIHPTETMIK